MSDYYLWIALTCFILISGIGSFYFLVKRYQDTLLYNFSRKIWMTIFLGLSYTLLFLIGNGLLVLTFKKLIFVEDFSVYLKNLWFLIRIALAAFILNAFLIVAFRSLIKVLYNLNKSKGD